MAGPQPALQVLGGIDVSVDALQAVVGQADEDFAAREGYEPPCFQICPDDTGILPFHRLAEKDIRQVRSRQGVAADSRGMGGCAVAAGESGVRLDDIDAVKCPLHLDRVGDAPMRPDHKLGVLPPRPVRLHAVAGEVLEQDGMAWPVRFLPFPVLASQVAPGSLDDQVCAGLDAIILNVVDVPPEPAGKLASGFLVEPSDLAGSASQVAPTRQEATYAVEMLDSPHRLPDRLLPAALAGFASPLPEVETQIFPVLLRQRLAYGLPGILIALQIRTETLQTLSFELPAAGLAAYRDHFIQDPRPILRRCKERKPVQPSIPSQGFLVFPQALRGIDTPGLSSGIWDFIRQGQDKRSLVDGPQVSFHGDTELPTAGVFVSKLEDRARGKHPDPQVDGQNP